MKKLKQFVIAFLSFLILDFVWLGLVMKDFNFQQLSEIGRIENGEFQMQLIPALVTYILMGWAVPLYLMPKLKKPICAWNAFWVGAPMGLIVYGVFDMTNLAILKNYPLPFVFPDMAWGTFAFGLVTVITSRFESAS
jgi:uncharacterized membrane protein